MTAPPVDRWFFEHRFVPFWRPLVAYHRFALDGAEHLPRSGGAIVLSTHSAATYDLFLFIAEAWRRSGRFVRPLGDRLWFRTPWLRDVCPRFGAVEATPGAARALVEAGEIVLVPPGGVWESLRPSRERFRVRWGTRRGFARLVAETGAPVHLYTCPAADHLLTVYESRFTDWVYRRWKFPLPLVRGWGPTWIPRPIALRGHLSPRWQGALPSTLDDDALEALRARLVGDMQRFVDGAVAELPPALRR